MKKFRLILGVFALMSLTTVFGQQDPQYTQYMYNMNILNPAYAGSKGVTSIGLLGRTQWVGVEGAPQTFTLAMHSPVGRAVGLGLSVIHDEIGPVKEDNVYADFSYTIFTSSTGRLAFGLKAGVTFMDVRELLMIDPDPLNIPVHETSPNFGAGVYYYTDRFYAGLSVPNFLETRHLEKDGGIVSTASEKMHYFLTSGYVFDIADNLKLKPSTMLKATAGAPLSVDLSLNLLIDERVELGLSHRFDDSISGMIGFQVNNDFRVGYAYDYTTSKFGDFNSGSHEILLLFDFNRKKLKSPRFF
ncbi:type IX secretion system membrane protein PorP/SprF [Lutibacter sp. A64]|uniref:PorP/SprF family type IX secretion system membrane protein n=1 Tax=Lutibacter sp. A64 TaxID=2918526 RepID=UPI001F05C96C|nr:type IX secretion system membrane protein PorP/SprF [Lutibacter sp. A64]UMB52881.1 type IX secretion system membrane protein PorP/SprF [Lutibacter sp. A64]UMB53398.1 type IX secretion system membrane protein PorP/SprF [Lutibacter sp. A64]